MLKNYFKIAWRHLLKSRTYSLINILGLSIAMTVALLIGLWVWDELSYNHNYYNHSRLALVYDTQTWNGKTSTDREVDIPMAELLRTQYPEDFKQVALISPSESAHLLTTGDKKITSSGIFMQPQLPEMLTLHMLKGTRDGLKDPSSIMLSASLATALFGNIDPIGHSVSIDSEPPVKVTGVFEDLPRNAEYGHVKFLLPWDRFVSTRDWVRNSKDQWGYHFGRIVVQLNKGVGFDKVNKKIKDLPKNYVKVGKEEIFLHPMDKLHLYNEFKDGKVAGGPILLVRLFSIIGIFILLLACINFMNLSTARSEKRAREVGIRKAIGSLRLHLIGQFLSESLLTALLALVLALFLADVSLPAFNTLLANKQLTIPWSSPLFWLLILGFTFFTGLVSGSYPAFYLSGFSPLKVLKGSFKTGQHASLPRKVLVTVQFTISIALIIGSIVVYKQIQFAKDRPAGYNREGLITVNVERSPGVQEHYDAVKNDVLQTGVIENMAEANAALTEVFLTQKDFDWKGRDPGSHQLFRVMAISGEFGRTVNWQIKQGRDFSRNFPSDSMAFILNEAAVKLTGLQHPIGEIIRSTSPRGIDTHPVIGVVNDMLTESPFMSALPTIYVFYPGNYIYMRVRPGVPMQTALQKITPVFSKYETDRPLAYKFTDEQYAFKFASEQRIGSLAALFTVLAIFISCLGLFGLASFVAEQRTKEIGIRKVLGATVYSLWRLLSKEFVALVVLSYLIAAPLAGYYLDKWLNSYEFHASMSGWVFVAAGFGALVITLLTVSIQSIKAALMNPAKSLKAE